MRAQWCVCVDRVIATKVTKGRRLREREWVLLNTVTTLKTIINLNHEHIGRV